MVEECRERRVEAGEMDTPRILAEGDDGYLQAGVPISDTNTVGEPAQDRVDPRRIVGRARGTVLEQRCRL